MNQTKVVTISFRSKPKDFETAMENAKDALIKGRNADIQQGKFEINNVEINIEPLSGGK